MEQEERSLYRRTNRLRLLEYHRQETNIYCVSFFIKKFVQINASSYLGEAVYEWQELTEAEQNILDNVRKLNDMVKQAFVSGEYYSAMELQKRLGQELKIHKFIQFSVIDLVIFGEITDNGRKAIAEWNK